MLSVVMNTFESTLNGKEYKWIVDQASLPTESIENQTKALIFNIFSEEPIHWKRLLCSEELKVKEEENNQLQYGWRQ